jgi:hypothetical protein
LTRSPARIATAVILTVGWILTLALAWPGQFSYDSVIQLNDGRSGFYHSWHPPVMAWLLGMMDALLRGGGLFIVFDTALIFGALLSLLWMRSRVSWAVVVLALICVVLPQFLLFQGIVWKDVLFANAAVAGFIALAQAERVWLRGVFRMVWIALAIVLFTLAALTRQNGVIIPLCGAAALGAICSRKYGRGAALLCGVGMLVCVIALAGAASVALATRSDGDEGPKAQLKLLRLYDIVGAVALDPALKLDRLNVAAPVLEKLIRSDGVRLYSPQRNDTLAGSPALQDALANAQPEWLAAQWRDLVLQHPALYLRERVELFRWVFLTPNIGACRPVFTGVAGPPETLNALRLVPRLRPQDRALAA